ncbi:MAG TPA: NADH-quinone oxidoreductase subunit J, partial [Methylomirabilota bacterium]|nr:NADH-quinone oxidoreductase subunit J [Methylomirabilota bacterium]
GAIMVLFIFAIMLLIPGRVEEGPDPLRRSRRWAAPVAAVVGSLMAAVVGTRAGEGPGAAPPGGVADVGRRLFTDYLFPFEVTSVLLLAALIGALTLARRRTG